MASKRRPCQTCGKNRAEHVFASTRSRVCRDCTKKRAQSNHRTALLKRYGITPDEYEALLDAQGGVCAVCGGSRRYNLHIDHDHVVERMCGDTRVSVRGLLCRRCNSLLAKVRDNREVLEGAARYLDDPPARTVLGD